MTRKRVEHTAIRVEGRNSSVKIAMPFTVWLSRAVSLAIARLVLLSFCAMSWYDYATPVSFLNGLGI